LFQNAPTSPNGAGKFYENVAALPLDASSTFILVSNSAAVKQTYAEFTSHLGSMREILQVFREKGFKTVRDVFELSR